MLAYSRKLILCIKFQSKCNLDFKLLSSETILIGIALTCKNSFQHCKLTDRYAINSISIQRILYYVSFFSLILICDWEKDAFL
jgi:hypothetical protein